MKHFFLLFLSAACLVFTGSCSNGQKSAGEVQRVKAVDFHRKMEASERKIVLDVRTAEEFGQGHLNGAVNYNIHDKDFQQKIAGMDKDKAVFVYCLGGVRSAEAARLLQNSGFQQVFDLEDGLRGWRHENMPVRGGNDAGTTPDTFTRKDFDGLLAAHEKVMIDYYAPWCTPCKKMEPVLEKLTEAYKEKVTILRLNVEEAKALSQELNIDGIPVVVVYKKGKEIHRAEGFQSEEDLTTLLGLLDP